MPLSDEQIRALAPACLQKYTNGVLAEFTRALESAATAPLLAQIATLEAQIKTEQCLSFRDQVAQLEAQLAEAKKDAERLDWMIFHSAKVCHSNDAEYCSVKWVDDYEECQTDVYGDSRAAIDTAIAQELQNTNNERAEGSAR